MTPENNSLQSKLIGEVIPYGLINTSEEQPNTMDQNTKNTSKQGKGITQNQGSCYSNKDKEIPNYQIHTTEPMHEWIPVSRYAPEFIDMELDIPDQMVDQRFFTQFVTLKTADNFAQDILLAHKVIESGLPNRFGCRIPVASVWNIPLFRELLQDYDDLEVCECLEFGFPISRNEQFPDPQPNSMNHKGATLFPDQIDEYLEWEV